MNKTIDQGLITEYEKFPIALTQIEETDNEIFVVKDNPKTQSLLNSSSDQFNEEDMLSFNEEGLSKYSSLSESWSDVNLNCENVGKEFEISKLEEELTEEFEVKFNVVEEVTPVVKKITISKEAKNKKLETKFKHQSFEAVTARLEYEDLEILRALKSRIKVTRQQYVKPDGIKRERITENMILRSLVKCFSRHSLEHESFNWGLINSEEDLFKEISKSFKGIKKEGINQSDLH